MKEAQLTPAPPLPRPKLDPRLATLVGLGAEAFAPAGLGSLEQHTPREGDLRRGGPLAFLRGGRRDEVLEVALVQFAAAPERRQEVPPSVPVFLRTRSAAAFDRLAGSGVRIISRARTIATADVALDRIRDLELDEEVVSIEWTGAFQPAMEGSGPPDARAACAAIGLDPDRFGDLDGRGCVVGVVDVEGIDFYHPSFVSRSGRTRLLSIWDQRATPKGEFQSGVERGPGDLGVVHRRSAIGLEIAPQQLRPNDVVDHRPIKGSHGTQTAGLVVGNGDDRPDARGVAPGADLVFVNTFGSGPGTLGAMTELADAIAFVVAEAEAQGKPCVVNISLGDDLGPRDGTSPVERFIDELLEAPGRAIVIAAGNARAKKRHVTATLGDGDSATFSLRVAPRNTERAVVEIWYQAGAEPHTALSVEIEAPGDGGVSPLIEPDGIPRAFDAGDTRVLVCSTAPYPGSTNGMIRIELLPGDPADGLLAGSWRLHVRARGRGGAVHAWVDHRYIHWENASDTLTLTTPATARRAIVVGAYDAEKDGEACFSGRGEDRGGVVRPDVLAPGVSLVTSWAASTVRYIQTACGTSVAAPLVSGAAALVLQRAGAISAEQVRAEILSSTKPAAGGSRTLWVAALSAPEAQPTERAAAPVVPVVARAERAPTALPRLRPREAAQIIEGYHEILRRRGEGRRGAGRPR
ncbi:MAG: S8 family serine peptidase [Minicystis sp.]